MLKNPVMTYLLSSTKALSKQSSKMESHNEGKQSCVK